MAEQPEVLTTRPGDNLLDVIEKAVTRSAECCGPVSFAFNGAHVTVHPGHTAGDVDREVQRQWREQDARYRASQAGRKATADAERCLAESQRDHDACMSELPEAFASEPLMVGWLCRYALAADHIGVVGRDFPTVARHLEAAGYKRGGQTGLPQEAYDEPRIMAGYLAGQAIDCLARGLPPHALTLRFADRYRAATSARAAGVPVMEVGEDV